MKEIQIQIPWLRFNGALPGSAQNMTCLGVDNFQPTGSMIDLLKVAQKELVNPLPCSAVPF